MVRELGRLRARSGVWLEVTLFLPVFAVLYERDVLGRAPLWLDLVLVAAGAALGHERVHRWLAGGDIRRRVWFRIGLHSGLVVILVYAMGWGPVLVVAFVALQVVHAPWIGSAAWRPTTVFVVLWIACAQAAVALGWVFVYVDTLHAMGAASLGVLGFVVVNRHLGQGTEEREQAEAAVRASEERFRALVQDSGDVIVLLDADGRIAYVSPSVERTLSVDPVGLGGADLTTLVHPDDLQVVGAIFGAALAESEEQHRCEIRLRYGSGGWRWYEVTFRNLLANPAVAGVVSTLRDVTERRDALERLAYDANHDALTGLANRKAFMRALERSTRGGTTATLFVDLDQFKEINDTLGHEAGDALLVAVAGMLRRSIRSGDVVARVGGDEFAITLGSDGIGDADGIDGGSVLGSADRAVAVANRLLRELRQPLPLSGRSIVARASIGIAIADPTCTDPVDLLRRADVAMYAAKRARTSHWRLYDDTLVAAGSLSGR